MRDNEGGAHDNDVDKETVAGTNTDDPTSPRALIVLNLHHESPVGSPMGNPDPVTVTRPPEDVANVRAGDTLRLASSSSILLREIAGPNAPPITCPAETGPNVTLRSSR